MQLHRNDLSPEAIRVIENTPKMELERLLGVEQETETIPNKWATLTEAIESDTDFDNPQFVEAWEAMKEGAKGFRNNFKFKNDFA